MLAPCWLKGVCSLDRGCQLPFLIACLGRRTRTSTRQQKKDGTAGAQMLAALIVQLRPSSTAFVQSSTLLQMPVHAARAAHNRAQQSAVLGSFEQRAPSLSPAFSRAALRAQLKHRDVCRPSKRPHAALPGGPAEQVQTVSSVSTKGNSDVPGLVSFAPKKHMTVALHGPGLHTPRPVAVSQPMFEGPVCPCREMRRQLRQLFA